MHVLGGPHGVHGVIALRQAKTGFGCSDLSLVAYEEIVCTKDLNKPSRCPRIGLRINTSSDTDKYL